MRLTPAFLPPILTPEARQRAGVSFASPAPAPDAFFRFGKMSSAQAAEVDPAQEKAPDKLTYRHIATVEDPLLPGKVHFYRFSNGMSFIGMPDPKIPLVSFKTVVDAGSGLENDHNNGIAHLLEHMIFNGTPTLGSFDYARRIESLGGRINGLTSADKVWYPVTFLPKDNLAEALKLHFEALGDPLLKQADFDREKPIVIKEIKRHAQRPTFDWGRLFSQTLWRGTPYARTNAGTVESVQNITRDDVLAFYAKHYHPRRRSVVMTGDFDLKQVLETLATEGSRPFPPNGYNRTYPANLAEIQRPSPPAPGPEPPREQVVRKPVERVNLCVFARGPHPETSEGKRDSFALGLWSEVMAGKETAPLYHTMVEDKRLVSSLSVSPYGFKTASGITLDVACKPEHRDDALSVLEAELDKQLEAGITEEQLDHVRQASRINMMFGLQTQDSLLEAISGVSPSARLAMLDNLTVDEVNDAARKYFSREHRKVVSLEPQHPTDPAASSAANQDASPAAQGAKTSGGAPLRFSGRLTPQDQPVTLLKGTKTPVEMVVRPLPNAPITTIALRFPGGAQQFANPATESLLDAMWWKGTDRLPLKALEDELGAHGLKLGASIHNDDAVVSVSFVNEKLPEALQLLERFLATPLAQADDIEKFKANARANIQSKIDLNNSYVMDRRMHERTVPAHAVNGDNAFRIHRHIESLQGEDLRRAFRELVTRNGLQVAVVGGLSSEQAKDALEPLVQGLPEGEKSIRRPQVAPRIQSGQTFTFTRPNLTQASVSQEWPAPRAGHPDGPALMMLSAVLSGGISGRLFKRFRDSDEEGLCYHVGASYSARHHLDGSFAWEIETDPANMTKVQSMFREELQMLADEPPAKSELASVMNRVRSLRWQENELPAALAHTITAHRLHKRPSPEENIEALEKVTPEDIQRVVKKYLLNQPPMTTILAPEKDLKALGYPDPELSMGKLDELAQSDADPEENARLLAARK